MKKKALLIFVKNLKSGHVKTRLAATVGNDMAMDIYQQLLQYTHAVVKNIDADKIVFYSSKIEEGLWNDACFKKQIQQGDDLGKRMENAFKIAFKKSYEKVIIIGTDCPSLDKSILENAFIKLKDHDVVIGPAKDGGYYLLGMKKEYPFLFKNIKWGTDVVLQQTIDLCKRNQLSFFLLPELSDIDDENDWIHFKNCLIKKTIP